MRIPSQHRTPAGSRVFKELVDRLYPGQEWRVEWFSDVSFCWTNGTLASVRRWKRDSGLGLVDRIMASVYESGDDAYRDSVVEQISKKLRRHPNSGGGDCFFLSVSYALFGDEDATRSLRKLAAIYRVRRLEVSDVRRQAAEFSHFMHPSTWAEDHAIQGLALALRADLWFVDPTQSNQCTFSSIRISSISDHHSRAFVRASILSYSASSNLNGGHFEALVAHHT